MPYNPQTQYRGDVYINQGGHQWADVVGTILSGMMARGERAKEEEKQRAREFKSLQEYADVGLGVPKDQTLTLDLDTLRGLVQGKTLQQAREKEATQQRYQTALAKMAEQQVSAGEALPAFMQSFNAGLVGAGGPAFAEASAGRPASGVEMTPGMAAAGLTPGMVGSRSGVGGVTPLEAFVSAARGPGAAAVGSQQLDNLLMGLSRFEAAGGKSPFQLGPEGIVDLAKYGMPGAYAVKTSSGQYQLREDPGLAAKARQEAKPEDEGYIDIPDKENPVFGPKTRLPLATVRKSFPELWKKIQTATEGGAAGAALALPKSEKELVAGKTYATARGPAVWDGKKFKPVQ
jgi:hypothetical protein